MANAKMKNLKKNEKIIVVVGPTASGKSALAINLAKKFDGEIVSADSMQIYKTLNIGTAKESKENMMKIKHHMIDIVEPNENFSVAEWQEIAKTRIEEIRMRGKIPIIAGGTGLYIEALLYPFSFADATKNEAIRNELKTKAENLGEQCLYDELKKIDEETASTLHPNDVKKIIRALEIFYTTGKKKSESANQKKVAVYDVIFVGINDERSKIYDRINTRVEKMFENGLIEEIESLKNKYKNQNIFQFQSMQAIGYKEFDGFDGENLDLLKEKIKLDTRHYAKRQLTWFRRYDDIVWFFPNETEKVFTFVDKQLNNSSTK